MKLRMILITILLISFITPASAYDIYYVKKGDTLSEILYSHDYKPLYGEQKWVDKVLEINRLTADSTKKLEIGEMIIIPSAKEVVTEKVVAVKEDSVTSARSATMRTGLLSGWISRHQSVYINMDYFNRSTTVNSENVNLRENFGIGIGVESRNDFEIGSWIWNPTMYGGINSQSSADFESDENLDASFQPSWHLGARVDTIKSNMPVKIGAITEIEESSSVDYADDDYVIRRDRMLWLGLAVSQDLDLKITHVRLDGSVATTAISDNLNDYDNANMVRLRALATTNLTANYHLGAFVERINITNTKQDDHSDFGMRVSYQF